MHHGRIFSVQEQNEAVNWCSKHRTANLKRVCSLHTTCTASAVYCPVINIQGWPCVCVFVCVLAAQQPPVAE